MFRGRVESWNLRDTHMFETLAALAGHLGPRSRIAVWAHNSHLGAARATELGAHGELNLGQLVRTTWPDDSLLVGFTTYTGSLTAGPHRGGRRGGAGATGRGGGGGGGGPPPRAGGRGEGALPRRGRRRRRRAARLGAAA